MLMCVLCPVQAPTLTMEGGRLKRSLQLLPRRDFETVPEPVWRALYHWYGANLSLPRPVSEHSKPTHPLNFTLTVMQYLGIINQLLGWSRSSMPSKQRVCRQN